MNRSVAQITRHMSKPKTAITPTREDDFPEWYQQVIKAADMAENSEVRGCMVIKPWGYGIWELIQRQLDIDAPGNCQQMEYKIGRAANGCIDLDRILKCGAGQDVRQA